MYTVLSPAKALDTTQGPFSVKATQPALLDDAAVLMKTARRLKRADISRLMSLSDPLTDLNFERYQTMSLPISAKSGCVSAFTFDGGVYKGLDARTLKKADLNWAQKHVGILSGMFGLLRPLDLMLPYRLEMGTKLENPRGKNLYAFWEEKILDEIRRHLKKQKSDVIVNLASNEYFKSVKAKRFEGRIVECVFEDWKTHKDEGKVLSFMAKRARGLMARYIIENRVTSVDGLRGFDAERYRIRNDRSTPERLVFSRKFISAAEQKAAKK